MEGTLGIKKNNNLLSILQSLWTESPIQTTGLLITKVACLWIYKLGRVLESFPRRLLCTIMDALWAVVTAQPQPVVVGGHFAVTMIKLLNVLSRIPIIHLLPINFCRNSSWNVGAAVCPEGRLSSLTLSSVYSLTVEDGGWSTPMVPVFRAKLSGRVKLSARRITIELSRKRQHDNFISMARQKACTFKKMTFLSNEYSHLHENWCTR